MTMSVSRVIANTATATRATIARTWTERVPARPTPSDHSAETPVGRDGASDVSTSAAPRSVAGASWAGSSRDATAPPSTASARSPVRFPDRRLPSPIPTPSRRT